MSIDSRVLAATTSDNLRASLDRLAELAERD